ncbi:MAG: aminotransferase class V-fold PLP-dependent enzyme [Clostridia bacterium]|nr:aminotransferase class V-fold PLP-dependent enzyme [Clostridia bacterium]
MEKPNTSFFLKLQDYKKKRYSSFHTPGHKNSGHLSTVDFLKLDFTELPGTDDLFSSSGVILQSEKKAAEIFKAKRTLFSAGGCSLCIQTMLRLACPAGGKIISSRIIHKSAVSAMALLNIEPVWLTPGKDRQTNFWEPINPQVIYRALQANKDAKAIYLTSLDYFGVIADIRAIAEICKDFDVLLLVDNAHGSHLGLLKENLHPIYLGADMCADSAHKTLPVFTGGAFLHINNSKFVDIAKNEMQLFASTSPSFPILSSLDVCCDWIKKHGKKRFANLENKVAEIKELALRAGLTLPKGKVDPTRISFNTAKMGISGEEFANYLRKFKVEPEFSIDNFVVLIPSPFNRKIDFKRLKRALLSLSKARSHLIYPHNQSMTRDFYYFEPPQIAASLNKTLFAESYKINTEKSLGKISKHMVCPSPPGVPIVLPGEIITNSIIENLTNYGVFSLDVLK